MFDIATRSAWRWKMWKLSAATTASRIVFCCTRNPGLVPGVGSYHVPHSSTMSPTFFSGSYLSMMAECLEIMSSIRSVWPRVAIQSDSSNAVAEPLSLHPFLTV